MKHVHLGCAWPNRFPRTMAARLDMSILPAGVERTPQGGLRIPTTLTRAGVFLYRNSDGSERRELRHPDEVFHPASLKTLRGATVTVDHPNAAVRSDNWRDLAAGHVGDEIRRDGYHVDADIVLSEAKTVARVDRKELREASCGYDCDYTPGAGEWEGERFDGRQSNIRYNHVALGPAGWARGGPEVRMHLDGGTDVAIASYPGSMPDPVKPDAPAPVVQVIPVAEFERVRADGDAARARADAATAKIATLEAANRDLVARLDGMVRDQLAASVKLPEGFDTKGKSTREIIVAAITLKHPTFKADGKSDDYVQAFLDALPREDAAAAPVVQTVNPLRALSKASALTPAPTTTVKVEDAADDPIAKSLNERSKRNSARYDAYNAPVRK